MNIGSLAAKLSRRTFIRGAATAGVGSAVPSIDLTYGAFRPIAALGRRKVAVKQEQKSIEEIGEDNADLAERLVQLLDDPRNADKLQEFAGAKYFMLELAGDDDRTREYVMLEYRPGDHPSLVLRRNKLGRLSDRIRNDYHGLYRYLERNAPVTNLFDIHDVGEMGLKIVDKDYTADKVIIYDDEGIRHRLILNGEGEMQVGNSSRNKVDLDPSLFGSRLGKDVGNKEGIFRVASEHYRRLCEAFIDALKYTVS